MDDTSLSYPLWQRALAVVGALPLLLYVAWWNEYPIIMSDTGTHLYAGWLGEVPLDRPLFYGFFLRHSSLAETLWLSVVAQSLLLGWVLYRWVLVWLPHRRQHMVYLLVVTGLSLLTGTAYLTGYLLPDVFTMMLILSLSILLFHPLRFTASTLGLSIIALYAMLCMNSNLLVAAATLVVLGLLAWRKWLPGLRRRGLILCMGLVLAGWLGLCSMYAAAGYGFTLNPYTHVLLMGRMYENGLLYRYLKDSCPQEGNRFCHHKEELRGNFLDYLWNKETSVLYKLGGWDSTRTESEVILKGILSNPKYLAAYGLHGVEQTCRQLVHYDHTMQQWATQPGTYPAVAVRQLLPQEGHKLQLTRQHSGELQKWLDALNYRQQLVMVVALLLIGYILGNARWRSLLPHPAGGLVILSVVVLLANAFFNGFLSSVLDLYQARVIALVPLTALVVVWHTGGPILSYLRSHYGR